jgi:hypothetical protein
MRRILLVGGIIIAALFGLIVVCAVMDRVHRMTTHTQCALIIRDLIVEIQKGTIGDKEAAARFLKNMKSGTSGLMHRNGEGDLVDRWGHPFVVDVQFSSSIIIDVRSAGPDGLLGTPDDIHRSVGIKRPGEDDGKGASDERGK